MIVATLDGTRFPAFYRLIVPSYARTPCSGMGAARQGGRFNRPEQEALYLAADIDTALAEYQQDNPWLQPGTICTFFANGMRVADLSAGFDPEYWNDLWADFAIDWRTERFAKSIEPVTWYMADEVIAAGLDGILFPSQARPGGINLVLYRSSQLNEVQLKVYDPAGSLEE
ncbi:RES family NAD+ phosphorylase [Gibbsiella quercinecans]|uniref:RES family NAD+ phosphorylase n=1 Tax=Gibbsiella quercinecans TaxID=929813 RepID=UPI003A4E3899